MLAIGTFIELGSNQFQNFFHDESINWDGETYLFAGFGYSGSSVDLQGGNIDATLVFSVNAISLALAKEAADEQQIITVKTVWLDPASLRPQSNYMTDTFMVTGFEHDNSRLSLRLSSPLDAITGNVPRRRLTERLVGSLPSTGQIQLI